MALFPDTFVLPCYCFVFLSNEKLLKNLLHSTKMLLFEASYSGINLGLTVRKKHIWGKSHPLTLYTVWVTSITAFFFASLRFTYSQ